MYFSKARYSLFMPKMPLNPSQSSSLGFSSLLLVYVQYFVFWSGGTTIVDRASPSSVPGSEDIIPDAPNSYNAAAVDRLVASVAMASRNSQ